MKFNFDRARINYIQISYKLSDSTLCFCKVGLRTVDAKTVVVSGKIDNIFEMRKAQDLTMDIVCADGLYRAKTKLKSIKEDHPYTYLFLENPDEVIYQQNREFFRIEADYPCLSVSEDDEGNIQQYNTETINLSANGISLLFNQKLLTKTFVNLVLYINEKEINIKARLVRNEKYKNLYKTSFSFVRISESDRDYISQICIQKQIIERRKLLK